MGRLIIVDEIGCYSYEIKLAVENNINFSFSEVEIVESLDKAMDLLEKYSRVENNMNLLINYIEKYKDRIEKTLEQYKKIKFSYTPKIFIYTDVEMKKIPEIVFSSKVSHVLLINEAKTNLKDKVLQCLITHSNCSINEKNNGQITLEKYVEQATSRIYPFKDLIGAKYLYLCCVKCIKEPKLLTVPIKQLYYEVGQEFGADTLVVDRSIRNLINKGVKNDKLLELCLYTNTDIRWLKVTNANILSAIVLGYQNQHKKVVLQ